MQQKKNKQCMGLLHAEHSSLDPCLGCCLQDRVRYEADALREQHRLCPEHVPAVYHFDAQNALIVMQYLPPPHVILRKSIVQVMFPKNTLPL